jgi:hypothetical protein
METLLPAASSVIDAADLETRSILSGVGVLEPVAQIRRLQTFEKCSSYETDEFTVVDQGMAQELAEFAARATQLLPIVRIQALEHALEHGYALGALGHNQIETRELTAASRWYITERGNDTGLNARADSYRFLSRRLAGPRTAIDEELFPDVINEAHQDKNPILAYGFLDQVRAGDQPELVDKFSDLDKVVQTALAESVGMPKVTIPYEYWRGVASCKELIAYGDGYLPTMLELIKHVGPPVLEYLHEVANTQQAAWLVKNAFPKSLQSGVMNGMNHLMADSLYAVLYHLENNNKTDVMLPLNDKENVLRLTLRNEEPLLLLKDIHAVMQTLYKVARMKKDEYLVGPEPGGWSEIRTIKAVTLGSAALYRIIDGKTDGANASLYIRPSGGLTYDATMEYGRPGSGVEASISYVVDPYLSKGTLLEIGKHRRPGFDNRVSFRIDREGVAPEQRGKNDVQHDPMQAQGTLSLDMGSILGNEDWLGTRIGRFLAWGNVLRTKAEGGHETPQLNHVPRYFDVRSGQADFFADVANQMMAEMERRRLHPGELTALGDKLLSGFH